MSFSGYSELIKPGIKWSVANTGKWLLQRCVCVCMSSSNECVARQYCVCWQIFPAVLNALKNKATRLGLVEELSSHIKNNRAMLDHQQFDLVVKLINCALQVDSLSAFDL